MDTKNCAKWKLDLSKQTIKEVYQQPKKWLELVEIIKKNKKALEKFLEPGYDVIFTGSGTSEFIGGSVYKELNQRGDRVYQEIAAPEIVTHPHYYFKKDKKIILVQCSRGGASPETFGTINHADAIIDDVKHLFLVCNPKGGLIDYAKEHKDNTFCLVMPEGTYDLAPAMTSSYTCMTLACYLCFNLDRLNEMEGYVKRAAKLGEKVLKEYSTPIKELVEGDQFEKYNFLGSCNFNYFAKEASIKILETGAGRPATWYDSVPGFRHGPLATIRAGLPILTVVFYENDDYVNKYCDDMISDIAAKECSYSKILVMSPVKTEAMKKYANTIIHLPEKKDLPSIFFIFPYAIAIHLLMIYRAWQYGFGIDYVWGTARKRGITTIVYPIEKTASKKKKAAKKSK